MPAARLVTRAQLLAAGWTDSGIRAQLDAARWQRVHRGVYATFTGCLDWEQRLMASLLYAGPTAVASHRTAAFLDGFAQQPRLIELTLPATSRVRSLAGVRFYRARELPAERIQPALYPPRTRVETTVVDLAGSAGSVEEAFSWLAVAVQQRRTTPARLLETFGTRANVRWSGAIRPALEDIANGAHSNLERHWLHLERSHGLPEGRRQRRTVRRGGHRYLDCDYDPLPLWVELDGRLGHDKLLERWRDMRRDNDAVLGGKHTLRFGWVDLTAHGCEAVGQASIVLKRLGWSGVTRRCGRHCAL